MRKSIMFGALLSLFVLAGAVSAQSNYAGDWKLDKENSELGERSRVKSMTMNVTQNDDELTYERKVEREERDGAGGRGRGRRGMRGGGNAGPVTFKLDGTETSTDVDRGFATGKVTRKAEEKEAALLLTTKSVFDTPRGEMKITSVETWSLAEDGKTLTVSAETETPRGSRSSKLVFTKS